jgi:preprotein translocase subunit SecD
MLHFPTWKTAIVLIVLLVGTVLAIPSLMPRATLDAMPSWFPKQTVTLGLDLQGGAHLLYEVGMDKLVAERLNNALDDTRAALRKANIGYTDLSIKGDTASVTLRDAGSVETAREQLKSVLTEGMELTADGSTLTIGYSEAGLTQLKQRTVEQSIEVIRRRIDETGTLEPTIIRQGEDRIVVQVPGVTDVEELKES